MVEMAISMLILVPIFLYFLMLNDMLFYRLNLQEAVISAQWDLTAQDYDSNIDHADSVTRANRLLYCDHSAAYNAYDASKDCDDEQHHFALSAHQCWMPPGAKQVSCRKVDSNLLASYPADMGVSSAVHGAVTEGGRGGGLYRCSARLAVINDRIAGKFMQKFSSVNMIDTTKGKGKGLFTAHHTNGGDLTGSPHSVSDNFFLYPVYRTAILTDTWAVNEPVDYDPNSENKNSDFFKRVKAAYEAPPFYMIFKAFSLIFTIKAWTSELIMYGFGLDIADTNLALKHGSLRRSGNKYGVPSGSSTRPGQVDVKEEGSSVKYDGIPWRDWEKDRYKKTYKSSDRGKWYMGCKKPQSC